MKRRDFLTLSGLALGSVLIPTSVARLIRETCIENGDALIIKPRKSKSVLYALEEGEGYTFHWGDPYEEPEPPTWGDYLDARGVSIHEPESVNEYFRDQTGCDPGEEPDIDLTEPIDGYTHELWLDGDYSVQSSTMAMGYHYLRNLALCPDKGRGSGDSLGSLSFIEGPHPGSNLIYAQAPDLSTLACLQHRLNELGEGTVIEIYNG